MRLFALLILTSLLLAWGISGIRAGERKGASVRHVEVAVLAFLLQVPLLRGWWTRDIVSGLLVLSYLLLLWFSWHNRHLLAVRILGIGILLNFIAVVVNGGLMPVTPETLVRLHPTTTSEDWRPGIVPRGTKDIVIPRAQTRLWFLTDILVIPPPFPWPTALSVGDLFIWAGIVVLAWQLFTTSRT